MDLTQRVTADIDALGFVRNETARQLRVGRSRTIGSVVLDSANPFFTSLARGAQSAAERIGNTVLVGHSGQSADREAHYFDRHPSN